MLCINKVSKEILVSWAKLKRKLIEKQPFHQLEFMEQKSRKETREKAAKKMHLSKIILAKINKVTKKTRSLHYDAIWKEFFAELISIVNWSLVGSTFHI